MAHIYTIGFNFMMKSLYILAILTVYSYDTERAYPVRMTEKTRFQIVIILLGSKESTMFHRFGRTMIISTRTEKTIQRLLIAILSLSTQIYRFEESHSPV